MLCCPWQFVQATEAQDAAAACDAAATAARTEADAAAKEGAGAARDFAGRVAGLTAAASAAQAALAALLEAEEGGRSTVAELQGVLSELSNATKVLRHGNVSCVMRHACA